MYDHKTQICNTHGHGLHMSATLVFWHNSGVSKFTVQTESCVVSCSSSVLVSGATISKDCSSLTLPIVCRRSLISASVVVVGTSREKKVVLVSFAV